MRFLSTASWSLNGWLTHTLYQDPDIAVRTALYPLGSGPEPLADPAAQAAVLSRLRS